MYTVYKHTCPNGKVYIGITSQTPEKRWLNGNGYVKCPVFTKAIAKHGWKNIKHDILFENLTRQEAEIREIELIGEYKSNQREYGYNLANGGNCKGKHSEETKRLIGTKGIGRKQSPETIHKRIRIGEDHYLYGKQMPEETKKKISAAKTGGTVTEETKKKISETMKGTLKSEDHKRKVAESHHVKIMQLDTNGKLIAEWESIKRASQSINKNHGHIVQCCQGKRKTAYGYIWRYKETA